MPRIPNSIRGYRVWVRIGWRGRIKRMFTRKKPVINWKKDQQDSIKKDTP